MLMIPSQCSVKGLACLFHLSPGRIQQLTRLGIVIRIDRGRYDLLASIENYIAYLHAHIHPSKHKPSTPPSQRNRMAGMVRQMANIIYSRQKQEGTC